MLISFVVLFRLWSPRQLDAPADSCAASRLTINVMKTKVSDVEHCKSTPLAFLYGTNDIEQVGELRCLGMLVHGTKGLSPTVEWLCKAARSAMFGLQLSIQPGMQDPVLNCKLFDTLVRPIISYCCKICYALGGNAALDDLERICCLV